MSAKSAHGPRNEPDATLPGAARSGHTEAESAAEGTCSLRPAVNADAAEGSTTVWYDGECPICRREIDFYRRIADGNDVQFVDATDSKTAFAPGLDRETALSRLHARLPDGRMVSGGAAFSALWRQLPGLRWLGRLTAVPWLVKPTEFVYRRVLQIRPVLQRFVRT